MEPDETKLRKLTDRALCKLGGITDDQFAELEPVPNFAADCFPTIFL